MRGESRRKLSRSALWGLETFDAIEGIHVGSEPDESGGGKGKKGVSEETFSKGLEKLPMK